MLARVGMLFVLVFCIGATECQTDDDLGEEEDVAFATLEYDNGNDVEGNDSGIVSKALLVIRDEDTFVDVWADHTALMAPQPAIPDVEFGTDMVIAAFMGERPTTGYRIAVEEVRENDEFITVEVEMETPGDGCATNDQLTQPHHVVVLDDADKPVQFIESTVEAPAC